MINVEKVKPTGVFTNYIYKAIPLAFDESMSYYETLCGLLAYLKDTILPVINNNADATIELQGLLIQLQNYVDNYFKNLDVQEEINNKLDEMAESGELTDIIAQYLQLAGVIAFDTLDDLENAENIVNGSICVILGKNTYNDGKTSYYKIRNILNTDIVDGDNLIAITHNNQLVGEKIINYYITNLTNKLLDIQSNQLRNNKFILIGDSYASGEIGHSWITELKNMIGISNDNFLNYSINGGGFTITENTFISKLNQAINEITNKNEITNILVAGGFNDGHFSSASESDIVSAIQTFVTTAKNNFPNAKITIAHIGWTPEIAWKNDLRKSINAYKQCIKFGANYITNIEYTLHRYDLFLVDKIHPTQTGCNYIAQNLYNGLLTGSCDVHYETTPIIVSGNEMTGNNYIIKSTTDNDISTFSIEMTNSSVISTTELATPINISNWSATILSEFDMSTLCFNGCGNYRKHQLQNILLVDNDGAKYKTLDLTFESNCLILLNNTGESFTGYKNFAFQGITFVDSSLYS